MPIKWDISMLKIERPQEGGEKQMSRKGSTKAELFNKVLAKPKFMPTRLDLKIKAIEETIKAYQEISANPKGKNIIVNASMEEAMEIYLTFLDEMWMTFMIDGDAWIFFKEDGNYYGLNNTKINLEAASGEPHDRAYERNKLRLSIHVEAYHRIKKRVDARKERDRLMALSTKKCTTMSNPFYNASATTSGGVEVIFNDASEAKQEKKSKLSSALDLLDEADYTWQREVHREINHV